MAHQSGQRGGSDGGSAPGRIALEVARMQAALLARLKEELGPDGGDGFAAAAQRLAAEFGGVTAAAVEAAAGGVTAPGAVEADVRPEDGRDPGAAPEAGPDADGASATAAEVEEPGELPSLYRAGHMRRRLEQLIEANRRYGHPFGIAVFDAQGPDARAGEEAATALATVGAALRDSIRVVDEAFLLEEDAICVLAPNLRTVEGVQMAERLLGLLDELERAGGLRISVSAGVVACPDHGGEADQLLHKADAAMWRARAVGQPVGVGALEALQDR